MTRPALLCWTAVTTALGLHAWLLLSTSGVHGGGDLTPHLRLVQHMAEAPAIRNVYPPLYHGLGALLAPHVGLSAYAELFAFLSAAAMIAAFRFFQRATRLPDTATALFALSPYGIALSICLPKVEAAGYAVALLGLGLLWRRKHVGVALALAATFWIHTASALFLGLTGGIAALLLRDRRALVALALGSLGALPLLAMHLDDGCTLAQAMLFSQGDYLRASPALHDLRHYERIFVLANPIALLAAGLGARALWRRTRPLAIVAASMALLYTNELWLAPFGARTTLDLTRGLTLFAIPVACAAAAFLDQHRELATPLVAGSALLALLASLWITPQACVSKFVDVTSVDRFEVERCSFRWRARSPSVGRAGAEGG